MALPFAYAQAPCTSDGGKVVVARPLAHAQDDWLRRAELAVQKNEDDLAKEALRRRKSYQVSVRQIGVQKWSMAPGAPNAVKNGGMVCT